MGPPPTPVTTKRLRSEDIIDLEVEPQDTNLIKESLPAKLVQWSKDSVLLIIKDKEYKQYLRFSQNISDADANLRIQTHTLDAQLNKLAAITNTFDTHLDTLVSAHADLANIASNLPSRETLEPVIDTHMDVQPTLGDTGHQLTADLLTNSDVQKKIAELLETHEQFKDKLFANLDKFSDTQLKENTRTRTEYNTFRDVRKELNKWYISCQLIKKNLSNEHNNDSYHYVKADITYSQAVVNDHVLKQVQSDLQQTLQQADLRLKLASIEHNIAKVDKLNKLLADGNNSLIFAKSFKGVLKVHRNLHDKVLFKPRRQPRPYHEHRTDVNRQPLRHTDRHRTDMHRQELPPRPTERFRTEGDRQVWPPRHTDRFREEFPSLHNDAGAETDDNVFEDKPRQSYPPRVYERNTRTSYRPRRDNYEPKMSFRSDCRRDSEWSIYEHHDDRRYTNRDEQQYYGRPRYSEFGPPRDYDAYRQRYYR
jgi:hypothetical protein